jgi:Tol biopolymer transport system component
LLNHATATPLAGLPPISAAPTSPGVTAATDIPAPTSTLFPTLQPTLTSTPPDSWEQGQIVYVARNASGLHDITMQAMRANAVPRLLLASQPGQQLYGPSLSPDSSKVVFYDAFGGSNGLLDVNTLAVQSFPYCNSPSFSKDGSRIICGDQGQFKFLDAGGNPVGSPLDVGFGLLPAVSPDDSDVAFSTLNGKSSSIWKISSSGGTPVELASQVAENYGPSWSPDGKQIAYQSGDGSGADDIWIMDQDGGNKQQITHFPGKFSRSPVWSPDGKWLAFVSDKDAGGSDYGDIYVASLSSRAVIQVTHTGGRVLDWRVSWAR